ncbi:MAG: N-acetylmuramoyl-L-alanine amidase [Defluviitaleaceae bacterium]|nr:N-acetylmuramoyl-L-alanine amidase [Defluviitaleaceae bacterium]
MKLKSSSKFTWALVALLGTTTVYANAPTVFPIPNYESVRYSSNTYSGASTSFRVNETVLPYIEAPQAEITMVTGTGNTLIIQATSEITAVEHFVIEADEESGAAPRLVLDIMNAENSLPENFSIGLTNVFSVRTNGHEAYNLTRIVFDMHQLRNYDISFSEDRTQIIITFEQNEIQAISINPRQGYDLLSIRGLWSPTITLSQHLDRYMRIAIDGNGSSITSIAKGLESVDFRSTNLRFITAAHYVDGYLIFSINDSINYEVSHIGDEVLIRILPPSFRNITIDRENNNLLLNTEMPLQFTHVHDYHNNRNVFTLNGDFSSEFGFGRIPFFGDYVDFIDIVHYAGATHFILNDSRHISSARFIQSYEGGFAILSRHPRDLYDFVVVLDAGHGGHDPGAIRGTITESHYVLYINNRVYSLINAHQNIRAFATRTTDVFVPLVERASFANNVADLFVSIHVNAFTRSDVNGTETFYLPRYDESNFPISRNRVANIFHRNLLTNLGLNDRGVRQANFSVLRNTTMPSVLLEPGFISNPRDYSVLASQTGRNTYVQTIYQSIIQVMNEIR